MKNKNFTKLCNEFKNIRLINNDYLEKYCNGLKARLHFPFIHAFPALRFIFEELTLFIVDKVNSFIMQYNAVNTYTKGRGNSA